LILTIVVVLFVYCQHEFLGCWFLGFRLNGTVRVIDGAWCNDCLLYLHEMVWYGMTVPLLHVLNNRLHVVALRYGWFFRIWYWFMYRSHDCLYYWLCTLVMWMMYLFVLLMVNDVTVDWSIFKFKWNGWYNMNYVPMLHVLLDGQHFVALRNGCLFWFQIWIMYQLHDGW
jgi:hypothetical protein